MPMIALPSSRDLDDCQVVANTEALAALKEASEAEASTVRMIFQRYAELGSVALLKAELERAGIVSKRREGAEESFPAASASLAAHFT
jgi:hypothetical protein